MLNWKNVKELDLRFELNKSIFLINILDDYYEFENKNKMILIFKKNNKEGLIKEEVSIDDLIYSLQIELPNIHRSIKHNDLYSLCFCEIDNIKKIIDNIKYLKEGELKK